MRSPRSRPGPAYAGSSLLAATREVLGWPGLFAAALGLNLLVGGRPGLVALGPASDAVRALARVPPAHLRRRRARLHPPARRPEPGRQPRGADRLEPALRVRVRHGRPLPGGAAPAPAVAAPAQGERDRPRVRRRGQHRDVRRPPGRAAGRGRPVLPLAVPDPVDLARVLPVLAVRTADQRPAPDHHQGARARHPAAARPAPGHRGPGRGSVRGADRATPASAAGAAGRRRRRDHSDAGAVRDAGPARRGPHPGLPGRPTRRRSCSGRSWTRSPRARAPG